MEYWRSDDDKRWIDYNGLTEPDGYIHINFQSGNGQVCIAIADDTAKALGDFLGGATEGSLRKDLVLVFAAIEEEGPGVYNYKGEQVEAGEHGPDEQRSTATGRRRVNW
jgi:hypothetical protein